MEPIYDISYRVVGGKIQIASDSLFTDSVTLHTISEYGITANEIDLKSSKQKSRYWRYYPPNGGYCNMAELFFYEENTKEELKGKIIGTNGSFRSGNLYAKEAAFDRDALTFFDAPYSSECWVGVDFGEPVLIDRIAYLPRNDGNCIEIGDEYELFYWKNNAWQSLGRQIADGVSLTFENCPDNALFLLHDHTKGVEERIFTYENGRQVWW
jgi:hypothetical protein